MSVSLGQMVKVERIDFIVQFMICSKLEGERRALLNEWLGELTEDLLNDLKSDAHKKAPANEGLSS